MKPLPSSIVTIVVLWGCAAALSPARDIVPVGHSEECDDFHCAAVSSHHDRDVIRNYKAFPCPDAVDIQPCICHMLDEGLEIGCSNVTSEEQLQDIFRKDFPIKAFYSFYMKDNTAVTALHNDVFNTVSFETITLLNTNLSSVSRYALEGSVDTLRYIFITEGSLTTDTFSVNFENYTKLEEVYLYHQQFTWLPHIFPQSMKRIGFPNNSITSLEPGTFNNLPSIEYLQFDYNAVTTIKPGTFKLTNGTMQIWMNENELAVVHAGAFELPNAGIHIWLQENKIATVHPGAFVLPAETDDLVVGLGLNFNLLTTMDQETYGELFAFIGEISIYGNPLDCGCDIAWIVMDPDCMHKIGPGASCANGTLLVDLDPTSYQQDCM